MNRKTKKKLTPPSSQSEPASFALPPPRANRWALGISIALFTGWIGLIAILAWRAITAI